MKVTFVIETGQIDDNFNIVNVDGIRFKDSVPLTRNFNSNEVIGECKVFKKDGKLMAEADLPDDALDLYPSIGFKPISEFPLVGGNVAFLETELVQVSLCGNHNVDPRIKRVSEQIKDGIPND